MTTDSIPNLALDARCLFAKAQVLAVIHGEHSMAAQEAYETAEAAAADAGYYGNGKLPVLLQGALATPWKRGDDMRKELDYHQHLNQAWLDEDAYFCNCWHPQTHH